MRQESITQLDEAVSEVFALMLDRECRPHPGTSTSTASPGVQVQPLPGIVALIHFSGTLRGACSIHLTQQTAAMITTELTGPLSGEEADLLTADTTGELCNMIAGSWKSRQPHPHASCHLSSPSLTHTQILANGPGKPRNDSTFRFTLTRIYHFEDHSFHLELGFD